MLIDVFGPTAHRSVPDGEVQALDDPASVHDLELAAAHMQGRGDVLVDDVGPEDDPLVEHMEQSVRADEPNEFDPAAPRHPLGDWTSGSSSRGSKPSRVAYSSGVARLRAA